MIHTNRFNQGTIILLLFFALLFTKCSYDTIEPSNDVVINLRWIKSYPSQTWADVRTGFLWSMSSLGAELPADQTPETINLLDERIFEVNFSKLGFDPNAIAALKTICNRLKATEEYQLKGSIDCGRFILLTLHSSRHYYKITNAPYNLEEFRQKFPFNNEGVYAVTNSSISTGERIIHLESDLSQIATSCYISEEGVGSVLDSSFQTKEFETLNLMANGQLQFLIFDENGNLKNCTDPLLSASGKPGKCMWCHESRVQPLFSINGDLPGYITTNDFLSKVNQSNKFLHHYRSSRYSALNWSQPQDHTLSELLYIAFMEPNAAQIAEEWGMDISEVQQLLINFPTHTYSEFPFLGDLYYRSTIDSLAPYKVEKVPASVRELSEYEPDYF